MIRSILEHTEVFVRHYLPSGRAWDIKNNPLSNIRKLSEGFCIEFSRADISIAEFKNEMMPDTTDEYIGRWEKAVGIPDNCFPVATDLPTRRLNVKRKLSLLGLQTQADFEGFATSLGVSVKVRSGIDHVSIADGGYETELPVIDIPTTFANVKEARQTIVVTSLSEANSFDYSFDFPFGSPEQILMECVFRAAKPSNCNIMFTSE
jgi:uncharacterized protein YmfQ (DUF2313 family)